MSSILRENADEMTVHDLSEEKLRLLLSQDRSKETLK